MPLIALASVKSSPGVTTAALALASMWKTAEQRLLVEAGGVDRISKGRVRPGRESADAWLQLERLLLAVADKGALRLLAP